MSQIAQNSLIMFSLLVLAILLVQFLIRLIAGKGIVLTFSWLILGVLVIDCELAFILGQIDFSLSNIIVLFTPGILITLGVIYILFKIVVVPLRILTKTTDRLAVGDLQGNVSYSNKNEIGQLANGLTQVIKYQQEMARLANQIANGNLMENVSIKSDRDELGLAFQEMISQLTSTIYLVSQNASTLTDASHRLSNAALQSDSGYISGYIHHSPNCNRHSGTGASHISYICISRTSNKCH